MQPSSEQGLEVGDTVETTCHRCGERYVRTERQADNPPRNTKFCPDHYPMFQEVRDAMVAGTWTIRDEEFRDLMIELIDHETPYKVWVTGHPNPNTLYIYDPYEVDSDVVNS